MAIASLREILQSYIKRRNSITLELTNYSSQKTLATAETSQLAEWKTSRYNALRTEYKKVFETDYKGKSTGTTYVDYTQLPQYQDEISYVDSYYQSKEADLTSWETQLDAQITTENTELNEINAYVDSFKQTLSNNIKTDYNY